MKIPVLWHISDGFWDSSLPRYVLNEAASCEHMPLAEMASGDIGVIVVPGQHSCKDYDVLNDAAKHFKKVVWIITGDEEGIFHSDEVKHPNQRKWWFAPPFNPQQEIDVPAPFGWTTRTLELVKAAKEKGLTRKFDWCFYGQMTHIRRVQCADALQEIPNGDLLLTPGFSLGATQEKYFEALVQSKFAPCPAGPCTVDSFRFAETLEAGCVPIVDNLTQNPHYPPGYWDYVFGPFRPFRTVDNWQELPKIIAAALPYWSSIAQNCSVWWSLQKKILIKKMIEDLKP